MTLAVPDIATVAAILSADQAVTSISIIRPKPGKFDEFAALQHAQHVRLRGQVEGVRGSRFFKSPVTGTVVLVTTFETAAHAKRFSEDRRFLDHIERVRPLIETAEAGSYERAYEVGEI